jgi:predicted RNase H-like HicB family nuclease
LKKVKGIVLKKEKNSYVATISYFPECTGLGRTEVEAIKKLGESISTVIEKMTNDLITLLDSPQIIRTYDDDSKAKLDKVVEVLSKTPIKQKDRFPLQVSNSLNSVAEKMSSLLKAQVPKKKSLIFGAVDPMSEDVINAPNFIISMPIDLN